MPKLGLASLQYSTQSAAPELKAAAMRQQLEAA
jgi:hypothetical protein